MAALGGVWTDRPARASKSPNEKLNIACIGAGGMGASDIRNFVDENIVALCDVDEARAADTFNAFPKAAKYKDFRKMLERKDIDAVSVSTPDHIHAVAAAAAMHLGKHVYCQKPLTHSVYEARYLTRLAARMKVATQMGTQAHASRGSIKAVEGLRAGAVGTVREVHVITDRPAGWWPQGMTAYPTDTPPVPATLDWDLWLGPAKQRPYNPAYLPFVWRGWWDFGTGALGDMACHLMDVAFWALGLKDPISVEAESGPVSPVSPPLWSVITYQFPAVGARPPVKLVWYDGGKRPPAEVTEGADLPKDFNGSFVVGDKGRMQVNHGAAPRLLPEKTFEDYEWPPETLPRPASHYLEWIEACKKGTPTGSNFAYAGPFTEAVLLGNVALRVGGKIEWDAAAMKVKGHPEAAEYIRPRFRKGWKL
jgi:predicted dehydrogenase